MPHAWTRHDWRWNPITRMPLAGCSVRGDWRRPPHGYAWRRMAGRWRPEPHDGCRMTAAALGGQALLAGGVYNGRIRGQRLHRSRAFVNRNSSLTCGSAQDAAVEDQIPRRVHRGGYRADQNRVVAQVSSDDVGDQRNCLGKLSAHGVG